MPFSPGGLKEDEELSGRCTIYDMSGCMAGPSFAEPIPLDPLSRLKPGAYCVIFSVSSTGRYSEKYDAYESFGSHYGFYLVVE
jgi:hypothetical protein